MNIRALRRELIHLFRGRMLLGQSEHKGLVLAKRVLLILLMGAKAIRSLASPNYGGLLQPKRLAIP